MKKNDPMKLNYRIIRDEMKLHISLNLGGDLLLDGFFFFPSKLDPLFSSQLNLVSEKMYMKPLTHKTIIFTAQTSLSLFVVLISLIQ